MQRVLVVHGEKAIRDMLSASLEGADYDVQVVPTSLSAQEAVMEDVPDLVLLDWNLPGTSAFELLRRLKRNEATARIPVILLMADDDEAAINSGFDAGAEDHINIQCTPRELVARIKAVLRRNELEVLTEPLCVDSLVLDPISYRVSIDGNLIYLSPTGFRLLKFFMMNQDRVFTRNQILDHVWRGNVSVDERTVDVHIRRLRKAISIQQHDKYLQTVRGAGYRFSRQTITS